MFNNLCGSLIETNVNRIRQTQVDKQLSNLERSMESSSYTVRRERRERSMVRRNCLSSLRESLWSIFGLWRVEKIVVSFRSGLVNWRSRTSHLLDLISEVLTSRVDRYDLTATIRFGPNFSSSIQLKSTNLPLHLEARNIPLVGSSSTSVVPATSSSKNSTLEKPSRIVHLKSPSISIPQPQASSSRLGIDDNLPAYVPPLASTSNFPSAAEEKRQLANSSQNDEVPSISTSTNLPPAYIDSNDPSSLTLSTLAVDEEVPEEPPSWEEAVREEAIEEWVAANACLGEET